jgi:serine/threonine protein phosphatase PrpC/CRP-like cAMP-binding protein
VAGRASIVGAAATHVGKVREHNEDAHFIDVDLGMFLVCDGMGGHAAGEVASALAIGTLRQEWAGAGLHAAAENWLDRGTPEAKKQLLEVVRAGVIAAHAAILAEAERDETKSGMGTTLVGAMAVGGELVFAHAGDSRAYLVRDGISMQLTEDHTLLARLLAAGIDVDVSGEGSRFRSMLTNALGIGDEVKVSTFVVPLADGDRFLLCSDGISEYVPENEVGEVLSRQPSPTRAAQRLVELALERGGGDNATAVVVRVLEAGETPLPAEQRKRDDAAIGACALWGSRVTPQQRLRALRIAIPRDLNAGEKLPPRALGDRVAWIVVEGDVAQDGITLGPGALVYPESLVQPGEGAAAAERDAMAAARSDVRALAIRADDFRELCDDDGELGEALLESLAQLIAKKKRRLAIREPGPAVDPRGSTDPHLRPVTPRDIAGGLTTDPNLPAVGDDEARERAATVPDGPQASGAARPWPQAESPIIAPVSPRIPPARPSPLPAQMVKRAAPPLPDPTRPSPLPRQLTPRQPAKRPSPLPDKLSARPPQKRPTPVPLTQQPAEPPSAAGASPEQPAEPPSRPSVPPGQLSAQQPVASPGRPSTPPHGQLSAQQPVASPGRPSTPPHGQLSAQQPVASPSRPSTPPHGQPSTQQPVAARSRPSTPPHGQPSTQQPVAARSRPSTPPPGALPSRPSAPPAQQPVAARSRPSTPPPGALRSRPSTSPPSRPSAPPGQLSAQQPLAAPSRPSTPAHGQPSTQPVAARSRPSTPPPELLAPQPGAPPSRPSAPPGRLSAPPPAVKPTPGATPRATPPGGVAAPPVIDTTARRALPQPDSPWDTTSERPTRARNSHVVAKAGPKGFAPALTPPVGTAIPRAATPVPAGRPRSPTDPEIETYLEIEAELPPAPGGDADVGPELSFGAAPRRAAEVDEEHESVSITIEGERTRVTVTETSEQTLTLTVTEPPDVVRPRAITAEDGASVSGIITIPSDVLEPDPEPVPPPRRAKRHSEGWDD